jgi:acylphosphatase
MLSDFRRRSEFPCGRSGRIPLRLLKQWQAAMRAEKRAKRFFVSGRVQGVGYRYFAVDTAEQIGVTGYAKNLADGRVEVYAIGTADQLRNFARELQRGPTLAAVAEVDEVEAEPLSAFSSGFSVTYDC